ncbi:MAG: hypothetical protein R2792_09380 [Saprospiraceae bacterium]
MFSLLHTWSNGTHKQVASQVFLEPISIENLGAGIYNITVSDNSGCSTTVSVTVEGGDFGGMAFDDENTDGTFDPNDENGLGGIKVYLYECDNPVPVDSTIGFGWQLLVQRPEQLSIPDRVLECSYSMDEAIVPRR